MGNDLPNAGNAGPATTTPDTAASDASRTASQAQSGSSLRWWASSIVGWLLLLVLVGILAALVVIPRVAGAQTYTVLTGSMEPTIPPGSLVVVRPTPADELTTSDVITFQPRSGDPGVVTHRIDAIYYDSDGTARIHTRGDANNVADDWVLVPEQVRGVLWYSVPQLGRLNILLEDRTRVLGTVVVAGALIVYAVGMFGGALRDRSRRGSAARGRDDDDEAP